MTLRDEIQLAIAKTNVTMCSEKVDELATRIEAVIYPACEELGRAMALLEDYRDDGLVREFLGRFEGEDA